MTSQHPWVHLAALAAGCTLLLAGCASKVNAIDSRWDTTWPEYAVTFVMWEQDAPFSDEQNAMLQDGEVTEEEVHSGFERYRSCLRSEGYELDFVRQNGAFIDFGIPDAAVVSGADAVCYASEYAGVDGVWQLSHSEQREYTSRLIACVEDNGVDISAMQTALTVTDLEQVLIGAGIDPADCPEF